MTILNPNWDKLSNAVRKVLHIPESKEPLPDLKTEMEAPNTNTGLVLYKPKELEKPESYVDFDTLGQPLGGWTSYRFSYTVLPPQPQIQFFRYNFMGLDDDAPLKPDSAPFETNMMEALIGWRAWKLDWKKQALRSQNDFF